MLAINIKALTDPFLEFSRQADRYIHIKSEVDYQKTLELVEQLFDVAEDSENEPLNELIGLLAQAIETYESSQTELQQFHESAEGVDPAVSALRLLVDQYSLASGDLKNEIGSKSLVSMILSGKRSLTREHISKLSARFGVSPSVFFASVPNVYMQ